MKVNKARKVYMPESEILATISKTGMSVKRLEVQVETMARDYTGVSDLEIRGVNANVDFDGGRTAMIKKLNELSAKEGQLRRLKTAMETKSISVSDLLKTPQFYDRIDKIYTNISNKYESLNPEQEKWFLEQINGDETYDEIYEYYSKAHDLNFDEKEEESDDTDNLLSPEEQMRQFGIID